MGKRLAKEEVNKRLDGRNISFVRDDGNSEVFTKDVLGLDGGKGGN